MYIDVFVCVCVCDVNDLPPECQCLLLPKLLGTLPLGNLLLGQHGLLATTSLYLMLVLCVCVRMCVNK